MGIRAEKKDLVELKNVFQAIDTDNDGSISFNEIINAENSLLKHGGNKIKNADKWTEILRSADLDGNGRIDFGEFLTAAVNHQKIITTENLKSAFQLFDKDGNGKISIDEFKSALPSSKQSKGRDDPEDDKKWKRIIAEVDTNGDGEIDLQEFGAAMEKFISLSYNSLNSTD